MTRVRLCWAEAERGSEEKGAWVMVVGRKEVPRASASNALAVSSSWEMGGVSGGGRGRWEDGIAMMGGMGWDGMDRRAQARGSV